MYYNLAVGGIIAGLGLTVFSGYKYMEAAQESPAEESRQKKLALVCAVVGLAVFAAGAGFVYSESSPDSTYYPTPTYPTKTSPTITSNKNCPIQAFKNGMNALHSDQEASDSMPIKVLKILEETQGVSCDNYLPWQDEFSIETNGPYISNSPQINGIGPRHMQKPVMWGIDPSKRPFVAIKYLCETILSGTLLDKQEGAIALSPRDEHMIAPHGYTDPSFIGEGPLRISSFTNDIFYENLHSLFKGINVVYQTSIDLQRTFSLIQ